MRLSLCANSETLVLAEVSCLLCQQVPLACLAELGLVESVSKRVNAAHITSSSDPGAIRRAVVTSGPSDVVAAVPSGASDDDAPVGGSYMHDGMGMLAVSVLHV